LTPGPALCYNLQLYGGLMPVLTLILLVFAFISFIAAAANFPSRVNLVALGLAFWVLTLLLGSVR